MTSPRTIYTLGHSTLSTEAFLRVLADNAITVLVDIRTVPRSRHNPQFEQDALRAAVESHGIRYRWMKTLGGLRQPRKDSFNTGWKNTSFRGYADYMATKDFESALDELIRLSASHQTAIMCAEAVPWRCHRSLVADAIIAHNHPVEDIFATADGGSHRKPHSITAFARIHNGRVWYPPEDTLFTAPPETFR